jgi:myosin V
VWVVLDPPDGVWIEATVLSHQPVNSITKEKSFVVSTDDVSVYTIKTLSVDKFNLEFQWLKKRSVAIDSLEHVSDMTSLPFLNEPEMLECMRLRFASKTIYTNTGPILIAINPFERLPLYDNETLMRYHEADDAEVRKLKPHVYQISNGAYRKMFIDKYDPDKRENQSILVNGESGAGKTESTKQVLHYLAKVSSLVAANLGANSEVLDFENLIIAANPITESFGNAKTSRNNNSSRFGKFIELGYVTDGYIEGAKIRTYLLETVRVTTQMPGERNYHIFYECFAGLDKKLLQNWGLLSIEQFAYCNQSGEFNRHDGESDKDNFDKLQSAMARIGLTEQGREDVFKAVACVLHIGNLEFQESSVAGEDMAVFAASCESHVAAICDLLSVDVEALLTAVAKRSVEIAGSSIRKFLNVSSALVARNTFARTLYDTLFKWMIEAVNKSMSSADSDESASFVAVLDIFGFEFFKNNSFEQLCINYANEKLQDHFNYAIFKSEQEVYREEGIEWTFVEYPDNSERLDLFEHKFTGIFALCNEQLKIPKPTDEKLAKEFYLKCGVKNFFVASRKEQTVSEFVVQHFACDVKYSAIGFLDKNRSEIAPEINACFVSSKSAFVRSFASHAAETPSAASIRSNRSVGKKTSTVSSQFCKQLQDLVSKIRSTRSHFIRCIKPNNELAPVKFEYSMVMSQLRCGGALGAIQVFRAGFPNRMDFAAFVNRFSSFVIVCGNNPVTRDVYQSLAIARSTGLERKWRTAAAKLIDIVALTDTILHIIDSTSPDQSMNIYEGLQLGKTQVFLRAPVFEFLESLQLRTLKMVVRNTQRRFRAQHYAQTHCIEALLHACLWFSDHKKRMAVKCVCATILLQRRARIYILVKARLRIIRAVTRLKAHHRGNKAREFVRKLKYDTATRIQSAYRCFSLRKHFLSMQRAVVTLQKIARGMHAKKISVYRMLCIIQIQAIWRGAVVRATSQMKETIEKMVIA